MAITKTWISFMDVYVRNNVGPTRLGTGVAKFRAGR